MNIEQKIEDVLISVKHELIGIGEARYKILSLMDENKNRLTGVSADNKDDD